MFIGRDVLEPIQGILPPFRPTRGPPYPLWHLFPTREPAHLGLGTPDVL